MVIPCKNANIGSYPPDCPYMKGRFERLGTAYSITGDYKCVGVGGPGCESGLNASAVRTYKWAYRAGMA